MSADYILSTLNGVMSSQAEGLSEEEKVSIKSEINNIRFSNNKITFETNHPNELHIVKVSYFPNRIDDVSGYPQVSIG